jgi:hypothetical protein
MVYVNTVDTTHSRPVECMSLDGYTVHICTKAGKTCSVLPLSPMYVNDNTQQRVFGQCLV